MGIFCFNFFYLHHHPETGEVNPDDQTNGNHRRMLLKKWKILSDFLTLPHQCYSNSPLLAIQKWKNKKKTTNFKSCRIFSLFEAKFQGPRSMAESTNKKTYRPFFSIYFGKKESSFLRSFLSDLDKKHIYRRRQDWRLSNICQKNFF